MERTRAINARWHAGHPLPKQASLEERVEWHRAHARECGCRPVPEQVAVELRKVSGHERQRAKG
jgi:hypothetical protein